MEQYLHHLMRIKSNNIYTHTSRPSHFNHFTSVQSREEQAFAENIGEGPLGGFVWPPRCYYCNFCERTFKLAQALGGHMNVHRRDRARLNQPLCLKTDGANKISIPDSSNPSDVLVSFYSNTESVRIIQGDLVTKKLACMNNILSKDSTVETGLSVGLNFCVSKNREAEHAGDGGDIKRRRTDGGSQVPLLYVACSSGDKEIDLELRLGESPTLH